MAIMGQAYFSALNGSITSSTALSNPFHSNITLGWNNFINHPFLNATLTDTHFDNPDRRGRLSVFLARLLTQTNNPRAIACDEYTAVCIDSTLKARVFGEWPQEDDNAYFVQVNCVQPNAPETLQSGQPLNWIRGNEALKVYRIKGDTAGSSWFDLSNWLTGTGGDWLHWWVNNGVFQQANGTVFQPCGVQQVPMITGEGNPVTFFPNPVHEGFVRVEGLEQSAICRVFDMSGRLILEQILEPKNAAIEVYHWPAGLYLVECSTGNKLSRTKLVIH